MTRLVRFLVFPGFQILDLAGPAGAFESAVGSDGKPLYSIEIASVDGGLVASSSGITVQTLKAGEKPSQTLIIAGGPGVHAAAARLEVLEFTQAAAARGWRVASVCSGAYILAAAGLLASKRVTTHWSLASDLQRRYPALMIEPDRIFIKDGAIWTSAGVTAGIDLALAMIAEDAGEQVAKHTAQELVVFHRRPGGQSQFSALVAMSPKSDRIGRVLDLARRDLRQDLSVENLAAMAGISPRQFSRVFFAETGRTPARAIEQLRVEAARPSVEAGLAQLEVVAREVGLANANALRRAFLRIMGVPPQAVRRQHATARHAN